MKKAICIVLSAFLCLCALTACGKEENLTSSVGSKIAESESEVTKSETNSKNESIESKTVSTVSKKDTASTVSKAVKKSISDPLEIGIYHLNPKFCKNYGYNTSDGEEEFEDIIKNGYVNSILIAQDQILNFNILKIAKQYDVKIWISLGDFFDSGKQTIDSFINKIADSLDVLKGMDGGYYDLIKGFHMDEPLPRGQSNNDFLTQNEHLYKKFGLRIYPVFGYIEYTAAMETPNPDMDQKGWPGYCHESMKYTTDIGCDYYWLDLSSKKNCDHMQEIYTNVLNLIGHDVNVWFYPCTYKTTSTEGRLADEDYMLSQMNFYLSVMDQYKHFAGFHLYNYTGHDNGNQPGLEHFLVLKDKNGVQRAYPNEEKYTRLSALIKETCQKFKKTGANLIKKL